MNKTLPAHKEVGPKRYRETSGLYYEDFEVGDTFEHRPGRTITDVDNIWMTLLTMNVQPVHFDAAYAAKTEWKKMLVDSTSPCWSASRAIRRRLRPTTENGHPHPALRATFSRKEKDMLEDLSLSLWERVPRKRRVRVSGNPPLFATRLSPRMADTCAD